MFSENEIQNIVLLFRIGGGMSFISTLSILIAYYYYSSFRKHIKLNTVLCVVVSDLIDAFANIIGATSYLAYLKKHITLNLFHNV